MHVRWTAALAVALVVVLIAGRARAAQDVRQSGDDARIVVDAAGIASVRHQLRWHVARGPLTRIELQEVPPSAELDPLVPINAEDGRTLQARAERYDERAVRITVTEPRAIMRGDFTFDVGWRLDLAAAHALVRDGATWRLTLAAPAAHDGFDSGRTVIELPAAPNEPRPIVARTGAIDQSAIATLRRGPQSELLELLRPHVARGEAVTWTMRVDARALSVALDARPPTQAETNGPTEPGRARDILAAAAAAAFGMGLALLVAHKARAFAGACASRSARVHGLLPTPECVRAPLAGGALAVGILLEVEDRTLAGTVCVSVAMLAGAFRASRIAAPVRGPGDWRTIPPEEAFQPHPRRPSDGHWLDIESRAGQMAAMVATGLVVAAAAVMRQLDPEDAWLVGIDAAAFVPLFITGRVSQLPPHGTGATTRWLARAFRRLQAVGNIQVTVRARVTPDGSMADELRLLVLPVHGLPGVIALEVGVAWGSTPVCWAAAPEVLARVMEGSPAALKLARDVPRMRSVPGRRPDERVIRLLPRQPTAASTVALVRHLAQALTDKRAAHCGEAWTGSERRADWSGVVVRTLAGLDGACLVPPCTL